MTAVIDVSLPAQVAMLPATEPVVQQLVLACSPAALQRRFFLSGPVAAEIVWARSRRYLLAGPPDGAAVVAMSGGVPVGLLNLVVVGTGLVDMSLLVVDSWQHRRVATQLLVGELGRPRWAGWTVTATVQPDNTPVRALLGSRRLGTWHLVDRDPSAWEYAMTLLV